MSALVVNADDLGVSKGATLGIVRAHREGIVTSASLAVTTRDYGHALDTCVRSCPDLGIGLHFTLTSGRPVSPVREVPLLVDDRGFFRWRFLPLLRAASIERRRDLIEQVEIELEAQIQKVLRDSIRPDHIDGERHVHLIPGIFEKVAAAARRHGIPFVRAGRDMAGEVLGLAHSPGLALRGGFVKSWLLSRLSRAARGHLRVDESTRLHPDLNDAAPAGKSADPRGNCGRVFTPDRVASYLYSGRIDLVLKTILVRTPAEGVIEVMVHPGIPQESLNLDLGNRELERYLASEDRRKELNACIEARAWTNAQRPTTYAALARERASC